MKTTGLLKLTLKAFKANDNKVVNNSSGRANRTVVNLSKNKKSKKSTYMPNIKATKEPNFLILNAKKAFNYLRLVFIEASIFWYFHLKSHIQIEKNALGYTIDRVLS